MHIVLITEAASGGVAAHINELINGLAYHPHLRFSLILPTHGRIDNSIISKDIIKLIKGVYFTFMYREIGLHDLCDTYNLSKLLHKLKPDIVHSHSSKAGALARVCRGHWKHIYTPHAIYTLRPDLNKAQKFFYLNIERFLGKKFTDSIIAVSDDEAYHIINYIKPGKTPVFTIYNGISKNHNFLSKEKARKELNLELNNQIIGFVGRLQPQKGIERLIAAIKVLNYQTCFSKKIQLLIIGPGNIKDILPKNMSIPKNIIFTGAIQKASRFFKAFDLFVLPSHYEGFPYVFLEAAMAGIPILSTLVANAKIFLENNSNRRGYIINNPDNPFLFAENILFALNNTLNLCLDSNLELDRFSAHKMCFDTLEVYKKLMNKKNKKTIQDF